MEEPYQLKIEYKAQPEQLQLALELTADDPKRVARILGDLRFWVASEPVEAGSDGTKVARIPLEY